jgi:N-acetylmuramoyl-L-alanine amidase
MIRLLGNRGASAVMGLLMLALASSQAPAQTLAQTVTQSGPSYSVAKAVTATVAASRPGSLPGSLMSSAMLPMRQAVATFTGQAQPSQAISSAIAREAAWLFHGGWPLYALVDRYSAGAPLDAEATCLATAVYFEARGESAEGQLAVARVVMNRAASGKYPPTWCSTVKQPAQFSFVRNGQFPAVNIGSDSWRKAQAITRLAMSNAVPSLSSDVLWYHANYVAPSWGRRLTRAEKIGAHIFYRA